MASVPGIEIPTEAEQAKSVYHLYVIHVDNRDDLQNYLMDKGISTGLHYPLPLHLKKAYEHLKYQRGAFPVSEKSASKLLSLPMFPELTSEQIKYTVACIEEYMKNK